MASRSKSYARSRYRTRHRCSDSTKTASRRSYDHPIRSGEPNIFQRR
jgi:hypothetical protein